MARYVRMLRPLKVHDGANYTAYAKGDLYLVEDAFAAELVAGGIAVLDHASAAAATVGDPEEPETEEDDRDPLAE